MVWKVVHKLIDMITKTKTKNITISKSKSRYIYGAVYLSKNHVIPHPVIAAILDFI